MSTVTGLLSLVLHLNGDPNPSGSKFQTTMSNWTSQVYLTSGVNLMNVFLVWLPNFSLNLCYYSGGSSYYRYDQTINVPHSLYLYTTNSRILFSILFLLRESSTRRYCLIHQYARFSFLFLIVISGLSAVTSLPLCTQ